MRKPPWCPPLAEMGSGTIVHLLAWELHERDSSWWAWVSWIQQSSGRTVHKIVDVQASSLRPVDEPEAYSAVPRRVVGIDGLVRPWSGESGSP